MKQIQRIKIQCCFQNKLYIIIFEPTLLFQAYTRVVISILFYYLSSFITHRITI